MLGDSDTTASSETEIPADYICPISLQIMVNPLMTKTGLNFERKAILSWLAQGKGCCPLTRRPMKASDLIPNRLLQNRIEDWRSENQVSDDESEESSMCAGPQDDRDDDLLPFVGFLPKEDDAELQKPPIGAAEGEARAATSLRASTTTRRRGRNIVSRILNVGAC